MNKKIIITISRVLSFIGEILSKTCRGVFLNTVPNKMDAFLLGHGVHRWIFSFLQQVLLICSFIGL